MEKITPKQRKTAEAIRDFFSARGYYPTVRELAGILRIDVRAAFSRLESLERKGILTRERGKSRSLKLCREYAPGSRDCVEIPLLGRVPAGGPLFVPENILDTLVVGNGLFGGGEFFIVQAEGDSMTGAHIMPGDYVVVKAQQEAGNGDIVVASIDGEVTIKRFFRKGGRVLLRPENPGYEDIEVGGGLRIAGRVVGLIRRF